MITGAGLDKKPPGILGKDYALATTIDSIKDLHILPPPGSNEMLKDLNVEHWQVHQNTCSQ